MHSSPSLHRRSTRSTMDKSLIPSRPAGVPMTCYKRMDTIDLEELIDLSTRSEKEIQTVLRELYLRYRINMINNAQLDNEKQALHYQVDDLKDQLEEKTTEKQLAQSELKNWCKQVEDAKRKDLQLDKEINVLRSSIQKSDEIFANNRLAMISLQPVKCSNEKTKVDDKADNLLQQAELSSHAFDAEMSKVIRENDELKAQIVQDKKELNETREDNLTSWKQTPKVQSTCSSQASFSSLQNELMQHQQAASNACLKIDSLENQLLRLEAQMHRYREVCQESEKMQLLLKRDTHKICRQTEEAKDQVEELQRICEHLQIRMERVQKARMNALHTLSNHTDSLTLS
ncbi:leucine-rich repeat flightless-interacting protein 2-like [Watersipora subatra]|uniref:leucine-rich repeat flightless-interacting protein 2-like n=1 Tax=Watersipora subatra TaxID=2589382 RepID=UPI00355C0FC7